MKVLVTYTVSAVYTDVDSLTEFREKLSETLLEFPQDAPTVGKHAPVRVLIGAQAQEIVE